MTRRMVGTEVQRGTKFLIYQGDQSHWPWNSRRMEPFHDTVAQDRSPGWPTGQKEKPYIDARYPPSFLAEAFMLNLIK